MHRLLGDSVSVCLDPERVGTKVGQYIASLKQVHGAMNCIAPPQLLLAPTHRLWSSRASDPNGNPHEFSVEGLALACLAAIPCTRPPPVPVMDGHAVDLHRLLSLCTRHATGHQQPCCLRSPPVGLQLRRCRSLRHPLLQGLGYLCALLPFGEVPPGMALTRHAPAFAAAGRRRSSSPLKPADGASKDSKLRCKNARLGFGRGQICGATHVPDRTNASYSGSPPGCGLQNKQLPSIPGMGTFPVR